MSFPPRASALLILLAACERRPGGPHLTASWTGADTTRIDAPAKVSWCPVAGRLEVTAIRDDLGFGLVVYAAGELAPGEFPGFNPDLDTVPRPSAAAAARKYTEKNMIAFQSDSGALVLTRDGDAFGARFGFRMQALDRSGSIRVAGEASGLSPGACPADSVPAAAPAQ